MFTRLAVLFFFSGASALVYQVLWLRQLSLIFGVTIYAASTVLATFMTGLAIGSAAVALTLPREPADRQPDYPDPDRQDPSSGENVTPLRSRASVVRRRASSWRCCCTRNGCSPAAGCLRS
jgi:hypothetical protein